MAAEKSPSSGLAIQPKHLHESGLIVAQLHQYNGFWFPKRHLQGFLNCQNHLQAQDSDIHLVTTPKSGTTWLKALAFAILNRNTHYQYSHPLLTTNPHDLVPFIDRDLYCKKAMPDLGSLPSPRLFASHLPYSLLPESVKQSGCKIVYLCRNPKDLFVSAWHFANKIRSETPGSMSLEDAFDKFCRGIMAFRPFWDHILGYYKESLQEPEKIMFLRYEELKYETVKIVKELAKFMGSGFSEDEEKGNVVRDLAKLCSFESLSNFEVNKNGKLQILRGLTKSSSYKINPL